ncbi:MAG TPA: choice-of-anchor J domain-containing protein, partial [Saprospiraceae bacterium]|nr:choice-of-anchor J domain-containing protein [Saprospiraceae bacterium]
MMSLRGATSLGVRFQHHFTQIILLFLFLAALISPNQLRSQILFSEDFDNVPGPTAGGPGTYVFPSGWTLVNVDNKIPDPGVVYVNDAWERREDFSFNVVDSAAFSTSWYAPQGAADDWMWTPVIGPLTPNSLLSWNAVAYDPAFRDGYEVRIMVAPNVPTGSAGNLGNMVTNSTVLFSTSAENSTWTTRSVSLAAFAGQNVYIGFRNNSNDKFLLLIDDVVVENINNIDISQFSFKPSSEFSTIPGFMNYPLVVEGTLKNIGFSSVSNPQMQARITDGGSMVVFNNTSTGGAASLAPNATVVKTLTNYSTTTPGIYNIEYIAKITEADEDTSNDTLSDAFEIVDSTFARDISPITGALGIGAGNGGYLGSEYYITADARMTSVGIYLNDLKAPGQYGLAVFKIQNGVPTTQLYASPAYTSGGILDSFFIIPVDPPLSVSTNDSVVVCAVEIDSTLSVGTTQDIFTPGANWVNWPTSPFGGWANVEQFGVSFQRAFVIRPNFADPLATVVVSPENQTVCSGDLITISTTLSPITSTVSWTRDQTMAVTGLAASGSGPVSGSLTNTSGADVTVMFIFTPTFNGMPGVPDTAYVTVKPNPIISSVVVNQPVFPSPMGSIVINATGSSPLNYSLNGGSPQASNIFNNLNAGSYNVAVSYATAPGCQVAYASNPAIINGVNYRKTNLIAGASPFQDSMWLINLDLLTVVRRLAPSLAGFTITGINGLATHPTTGEHYAILKVSGVSGRILAKINALTGVCTQIGNLGDNFSSITFRDDGQLFGVTGDGATVPETMYLIDHTNATKVFATSLGNGADGEVILHVPESNAFYHWSGNTTMVFEKIQDTPPYLITNIPVSGTPGGETFGAYYLGGGEILVSNIASSFKLWDTLGVVAPSSLMSLPDDLRGLINQCCSSSVTAVGSTMYCGNPVELEVIGGESAFQWYLNGSAIPNADNSTYLATVPGLYNCIYTDSCGVRDSVDIGIQVTTGNAATANAGQDVTICASTTSINLLGVIGGTVSTGTWSTTGTGSFTPSTSTLNAIYTFSAADTAANVVTLILTSADPTGACPTAIDSMVVTIDPESIINAGPDQNVCSSDTLYLNATLSGMATSMVWQLNSAFGSFVGPDTSPNAKFILNANGMAQSSISFGAMSNDPGSNVCQGGVDTVVYIIGSSAIANAGNDTTVCASTIQIQLHGSIGGAASNASWTTTGTGTFVPTNTALNASYVFSTADTAANEVTLILTTNDPAGLCGPGIDSVHIQIDPASIINAGPDQTVCATDTLYLNATLSGVATAMVWQLNSAFGSFVGPDTSPNAKFVLNANGMAQSSISFGAMSSDPGSNVCQGGVDTVVYFINPKATAN